MTTVEIILIIIALLALLAAYVVARIKLDEHSVSIYTRRLEAEAKHDAILMGATRTLSIGNKGYIIKGVEGGMVALSDPIVINGIPAIAPTISADEASILRDAIQLVSDSISQRGKDSAKLLTADEWQGMNHRRDDWQNAVDYLHSFGVKAINGGKSQGTYCQAGDTLQALAGKLQAMLLDLAVGRLPPVASTNGVKT